MNMGYLSHVFFLSPNSCRLSNINKFNHEIFILCLPSHLLTTFFISKNMFRNRKNKFHNWIVMDFSILYCCAPVILDRTLERIYQKVRNEWQLTLEAFVRAFQLNIFFSFLRIRCEFHYYFVFQPTSIDTEYLFSANVSYKYKLLMNKNEVPQNAIKETSKFECNSLL